MSEIRDRLITGTKHSLLANVIVTGAAAVQFIAVARILGKEDYGVFRILVNMTQIAALLAVAGLQGAMVKYVAEFAGAKDDLQKVVSNCLTLNVISAAVICGLFAVLSGVVAVKGYNEPRLALLIVISSATMFVTVVFGQFNSIIQGFQKIPLFAKLTMLRGIASLGCVVVLTWLFGLTGTAVGLLAGAVALAVVSVPFGLRTLKQHGVRFRLGLDKPTAKKMLNYGIPSALSLLLIWPAYWLGNSILIWYHGFGELGIFGAANSVAGLLLIVPGAVGIAVVPLISELDSQESRRTSTVSAKSIRIVALVLLPVTVSLAAFSPWLVPFLFGDQYLQAVVPLQLMAVVMYARSLGSAMGYHIAGTGRMWHGFGIVVLWFLCFLPLAYFFGRYGVNGLAWAYLCSYAFHVLTLIAYLWIAVKVSLKTSVIPLLAAGIFAALTPLLLKSFETEPLRIFAALLLCCGSLAVTCAIATTEERHLVYAQVRKALLGVRGV